MIDQVNLYLSSMVIVFIVNSKLLSVKLNEIGRIVDDFVSD